MHSSHLQTLAIALLALATPASAQEPVPAHREPRHHLVLDSTRFRVLDVRIPPGDTTLFHIHDSVILYVAIDPANTSSQLLGRDWNVGTPFPSVGSIAIDSTYVARPVTHRVTNPGPRTFHLVAVTSLGAATGSASVEPHSLPGVVEIRSSWYDQARAQLLPGSFTAWFTSASPVLVVQPSATGVVVELEGSARSTLEGAAGLVLVPARTKYRLGNVGPGSATAIVIGIK
jgi:hypothetical protein